MSVDAIRAAAGTQVRQVTAAIVVVGVAVWAFCRRRPQVAYALWVVVLVKCVVPPVWSSSVGVFSWWDVHLKGDRPWLLDHWKEPMTVPVHEVREMVPGTNETRTVKFIIASEAVRAGISWRKMSLLVWGLGAGVLGVVWLVRGGRLRRRIEKSAVEVPGEVEEMFGELRRRLEVRGHVWLRFSKEAIGPGLFGVMRPIVVVPVAMLEEGANGRLRMVLAHELAHVRRKDHWVVGLQMAAQVAWWFHPLVWWMNQQVGRARELSCDEAVMAELGCAGEVYGQMLVDVLKMRHGMRMGAFALGMRAGAGDGAAVGACDVRSKRAAADAGVGVGGGGDDGDGVVAGGGSGVGERESAGGGEWRGDGTGGKSAGEGVGVSGGCCGEGDGEGNCGGEGDGASATSPGEQA